MGRLLFVLFFGLTATVPARAADPPPDFSREVRPILSRFCFRCHGPDDKARKAKLRLDDRAAAIEHGALVPGNADSELVRRALLDADDRMPPPATKLTLTAAQKDILKRWVAAGAKYDDHWSFTPVRRPAVPQVRGQRPEARNPIDAFILARLDKEGLKPSPAADRATLLRRVSLDLIGLPPTPAELDAFLADTSPDAYEKAVDRLLASPHYGERWARKWLDLARYADTNGYEKDRLRSIWPYRDWVIHALNADMPFDQFSIKQLAGDMLPGATTDDRIATGFHRNTMLNEEGGIDPLEFRYHAVADRVATTGTVWLGLTLGCAQCHSHKYDPVSHTDYFRVFAFLNNADEPEMAVPKPEVATRRAAIEAKVRALTGRLGGRFPKGVDADAEFAQWLTAERTKAVRWRVLRPAEATSNLPLLTVEPDDAVFVSGDLTKSDEYRLLFRGDFAGVTAVRVEALPDERLPRGGPGAVYYEGPIGDFTLSEITAAADGRLAQFARASHSFAGGAFTAQKAIDGNPQTGWGVNGGQGRRHVAVFVFEKPLDASSELRVKMLFERHFAAGLGKFRISVTTANDPKATDAPPEVEGLLLKPDAELTAADRESLRERFHLTTTHLTAARKEIDGLRKSLPEHPTTLVMRERPRENPRPTFLHHRGEFLQPKEKVAAGVPGFLPSLPKEATAHRLGFAKWLVSRENPLTARVTVNRTWAAFFGRGLVRTVEDFGFQGEFPSHPELLDWLAVELMEPTVKGTGAAWSLKRLHKLIVTSATYRQSSRVTPDLLRKDPQNVLLARGPRVRLEAEVIRDSVLSVSGLLSPKLGGPSVFPPQPPGVTTEGTYGALAWKPSEGEDRYRRSLYTFAKRTAPFAAYATFDAPSGEACVARRDVSNTPLQALTLLNDPMFAEAARAMGKELAAAAGDRDKKVKTAFRRFVLRAPSDAELKALVEFVAAQTAEYAANPADAKKLTGAGDADPADAVADRAAWVALTRALMNLDEFITKN